MLATMENVRVAVDAMGGDHAPAAPVQGALAAAREGIPIALVGREAAIGPLLARAGGTPPTLEIVDAPEVVEMGEHPMTALRQKRRSSIAVGIELVRDGRAGAFVSAGNTGAVMAAATLTLGRQPGIERPALGTIFPGRAGPVLILDVGASADARPEFLAQYAVLGRDYTRDVLGISEPRIGLLNIGEEAEKGSKLAREAYALLQALPEIRFIGNVEGKDLTRNVADVIVTDGFTGNVALKTAEGVAEFITGELRSALTSRLHYKLAALVLRPALAGLRARIDYASYGGAPLLGLNGVVRVLHGRSDARAVAIGIRVAHRAAAGVAPVARAGDHSSRAAGSGEAS